MPGSFDDNDDDEEWENVEVWRGIPGEERLDKRKRYLGISREAVRVEEPKGGGVWQLRKPPKPQRVRFPVR